MKKPKPSKKKRKKKKLDINPIIRRLEIELYDSLGKPSQLDYLAEKKNETIQKRTK